MAAPSSRPKLLHLVREPRTVVSLKGIPPQRLNIDGSNFYTNFDHNAPNLGRSGKRGIIIYVSSSMVSSQTSIHNCIFEQQLWIKSDLSIQKRYFIGWCCIYRSPSANLVSSTSLLCELFQKVCALRPSHLLIVGDFNYNHIDWDTFTVNDVGPDTQYLDDFLLTVSGCALYQHIIEPTHFRPNQTPSTLDLVFTNEEGMVTNLVYLPPLGNSDHTCLRFDFNVNNSSNKYKRSCYRLNAANYDSMRSLLEEIDWHVMNDMTPEEAWQYFSCHFNTIIDRTVPNLATK